MLMIYLGIGAWIIALGMISSTGMYSERLAHKIKIRYFQAQLEKDSAYYDEHNPTEVCAKIGKETKAI